MQAPVLSDRTIRMYNQKGILIENPLEENQLQPNSVDLTLAPYWSKINHPVTRVIDVRKNIEYLNGAFLKNADGESYYDITPGEFVLMASREILNIPNGIIAFVQGRSSIARLGIQTEQAGLVDAGFRGTITFEVYNQTKNTIRLYEKMRIAQLYFFIAQEAERPYGSDRGSKYNGQILPTGSNIHSDV